MKKKFLSKKLLAVLIICMLMVSIFVPMASAYFNPTIPRRYENIAHDNMYLNVSTWQNAVAGNNVTTYSFSGSDTQTWYEHSLGGINLRIESKSNSDLILKYDKNTTKCIVDTWEANEMVQDYTLKFESAGVANDVYIKLAYNNYGPRYLGTSGAGNSSQTYWYYNSKTPEETWIM